VLDLSAWTSLVDFSALVASLWLGLYIVTRGPRSRVSWLAGLTLWSLSGYFLDSFLHLNPPQERALAWWMGWTILLSAPLWLHLATLLLDQVTWWRRVLVWGAYAWALVLVVAQQVTGDVFGVWTGASFAYATAQQPGTLYPLAFLLLILPPILSVAYLYKASREARSALRRQFGVLMLATILALLGGTYLTLSVWIGLDVALLPGQLVLAVALVLLGYGVARYNALVEGRSSRLDFAYGALAIAVVVSIYLLVVYFSSLVFEIPFAAFILLLVLVILTHSLYEWGGSTLERLFYRRRVRQLRANLRAFARETGEHDLAHQLQDVLATLCRTVGCAGGGIVFLDGDERSTVAVYPAGHELPAVPASVLAVEETLSLSASEAGIEGLDDVTLVPLHAGSERLGAILAEGGDLASGDLDLLDAVADQVAGIVYAVRRQDQAAEQIEEMIGAFRERERELRQEMQSVLAVGNRADAPSIRPLVESALRHLYDYAYLGEHELAGLHIVQQRLVEHVGVITSLDRGRALSQVLVDVIEKLRPPGAQPKPLTREWEQYIIVHDAYVLGELNRDIMNKLYISESSFNRARRRAVRGVARAVEEMERAAREEAH
jgi:hypothetical protein